MFNKIKEDKSVEVFINIEKREDIARVYDCPCIVRSNEYNEIKPMTREIGLMKVRLPHKWMLIRYIDASSCCPCYIPMEKRI